MIATVLADVLGVSSASIAQHSPAHAIPVPSGQCTSPSGTCSRRPIRPPILALSLRSLCQYARPDRKSTRLNSSHTVISHAVFFLQKKKLGGRGVGAARERQLVRDVFADVDALLDDQFLAQAQHGAERAEEEMHGRLA